MEKLRLISSKKQWLAVTLGLVLGMIVIGSAVYTPAVEEQAVEQSDDQETETVSELEIQAVQTGTQASVERTSYLIEILPEIEKPKSITLFEVSFLPSPSRVFEILFEHIISPNSP